MGYSLSSKNILFLSSMPESVAHHSLNLLYNYYMKYIFFPGNNFSNKKWIYTLSKKFLSEDRTILNYSHWETGERQIDFNKELEKIKVLNIQEDCIAICKSAGCYLSYLSSKNNYLNIKKFIFIGYPYLWLENLNFNPIEALEYSNERLLIIQKENDPVIGYADLTKILEEKGIKADIIKYKKIGEDYNTHDYEDTKYLMEEIEKYLN